jgi:oxygen-independent coproporphyrinogen-3 oxidase
MLMCNFELSISSLEQAFPITFKDYFVTELELLQEFADMGLLTLDDQWISVTLRGRLLIRNICMAFDHHLQQARRLQSETVRYSQTL